MRVVIVGGGPGGYEAALVAADLGAEVTVVNDEGLGGACVLWDCVPSKTLLTSAQAFNTLETAPSLGVHFEGMPGLEVPRYEVDLATIMTRVRDLALAQSEDISKRVVAAGARVVLGRARVVGPHTVEVRHADGGADGSGVERLEGDAILVATGSDPRRMDTAPTDGEVILSSQDVYKLREVPEHLVVVGAGATGAEYATAFLRFGARVTFVCSRDRILPTQDEDAALVIEDVFERRGLVTVKNARAAKVERVGDRGVVHLDDGRTVEGSHVLLTVGQVPQTNGLGLEELGIQTDERGAVVVDGVSRTSVPSIYAAGDVTAKLMLASVAAMQGRIAMYHLLGQAVVPAALGRGGGHHLHRPADRHRRPVGAARGRDRHRGRGRHPAAGRQLAGQDEQPARRLRQAAGPARLGDDRRRGGGGQLRLRPDRPHLRGLLQPAHGQPARPGVPDLPVVRRVDPGVRPPPGRAGPGFLPVLAGQNPAQEPLSCVGLHRTITQLSVTDCSVSVLSAMVGFPQGGRAWAQPAEQVGTGGALDPNGSGGARPWRCWWRCWP